MNTTYGQKPLRPEAGEASEERAAIAGMLAELQSEQRLRAAVSGGAALLLPEEAPAILQPQRLLRVAEALGVEVPVAPVLEAAGSLNWNTGPIVFSGGVPVGGWANLTLFPGGSYNFTGHFHVSGAPSYNTALVWGVKSGSGAIYTFAHQGRVHGTFEPGSRDDDWTNSGHNPALAEDFHNLLASWSYRWDARVNFSLGGLVEGVKTVLGVAGAVIAVV